MLRFCLPIYPLSVVDDKTADLIVSRMEQNLRAAIGIKRDPRGSFYRTDYESQTGTVKTIRRAISADDLASRNELFARRRKRPSGAF